MTDYKDWGIYCYGDTPGKADVVVVLFRVH